MDGEFQMISLAGTTKNPSVTDEFKGDEVPTTINAKTENDQKISLSPPTDRLMFPTVRISRDLVTGCRLSKHIHHNNNHRNRLSLLVETTVPATIIYFERREEHEKMRQPVIVVPLAYALFLLLCSCQQWAVNGFVTPSGVRQTQHQQQQKQKRLVSADSTNLFRQSQEPQPRPWSFQQLSAYVKPEDADAEDNGSGTATATTKSLHPRIGDLVRYYDLDGGIDKGEEFVGKITFMTKTSNNSGWLAELTELEDVGDGYYAEYGSSKRMSKKTDRDLRRISPIAGSFVRSEQAFKIPMTTPGEGGRPRVRQEMYDLDDFDGPQAAPVNVGVVEQDGLNYSALKTKLLKTAALTGLAGTVAANIVKGPEDAAIYFAGALASVAYLYLLSVKTDTLASPDGKMGKNVANVRFLMPILVVAGVALYNKSLGEASPVQDPGNPFDTVTAEQFGSAIIGFLTYRVPLFVGQIQDAFKDMGYDPDVEGAVLPGSAGMVMKLAKSDAVGGEESAITEELVPVLLVSGPQATGRSELVQQLLSADDRLVAPKLVDRLEDGVTFERLQSRRELLMDDGRFGLTKDAILTAAADQQAVVVDADVDLAKKLVQGLAGTRLIGVWVGLNSVGEFEERLLADIDSGKVPIPPEESRDSVLRARVKDIINEIDYGLSSGIFEFTILNDNAEKSLKELKEAAGYCFK
jgi:hypothetical protein